jgi:hypothetical protein
MITKFDPDRRYQVEECLGRRLTDEEIIDAASLEELSAAQLTVINILAHRNRLAALLYLRGVARNVLGDDAIALIDRIRETSTRA